MTPEENRSYLRERYANQRADFYARLGGRCAKCATVEGLQIDHINPADKSFEVGRLWGSKHLPMVYAELEKCQLLCFRCHAEKTAREQSVERGWTHGTAYGWGKKKCRCEECLGYAERRNATRRVGSGYGPRLGPDSSTCRRGHELSGDNVRMRGKYRVCKACHRERARAARERARQT